MTAELVLLLDKELPHLRGAERDDLAAKLAAFFATRQCECSTKRKRRRK